jgi:prolipoprotein diacylglyceryltransferase
MYSELRSGFFTGVGLAYGMMTVVGVAFSVLSFRKSLKVHKNTQTQDRHENMYKEIFDRIG